MRMNLSSGWLSRFAWVGVAVALAMPALAAEKKPGVQHVDAAQAAQVLKSTPDIVVLDIRTPDEYKAGHIAGARNIDFYATSFEKSLQALDKSKPYLVHCASGGRSTKSLVVFEKLQFKSVYHLDGGFKGWQKAGQPVEK